MGRHLHRDPFRRGGGGFLCRVLFGQAREHQFPGRVLVIDDQQRARVAAGHGEEADEVVVVAELLVLRGGRWRGGIEGRRSGHNGIAPADEDVGVIALRNVMRLGGAGHQFGEVEGGMRR